MISLVPNAVVIHLKRFEQPAACVETAEKPEDPLIWAQEKVVFISPSSGRILGYAPEQINGMTYQELWTRVISTERDSEKNEQKKKELAFIAAQEPYYQVRRG